MNRAYKNTKHYRGAQSQKQNSECRVLVMVYTLEKKKSLALDRVLLLATGSL